MHDDDPLMLGLADLLARNVAGDLHRCAPLEDAESESSAEPLTPAARSLPSASDAAGGELVLPRPGLLVEGKRQLTRLIGSGSFGTVYEARQLDLDRREAIKFLHERWMDPAHREVRTRFLEEARVMARMRGAHLVEVHDYGTLPGGIPFFVMERLAGQTLRARLRTAGELPLAEVFDVAAQVLEGLCEAHAHSVVHRDVKPENIFLAEGGVKLLDFGLAKTSVALTASDAVVGTPLYMAPELLTGESRPDARIDVYAAAAVMYEMLTGAAPFRQPGLSRRELEHAVVHELPVPPSARRNGIPPMLEALVLDGLSKLPAERPRTARAMLVRLCEARSRWADDGDDGSPPTQAHDSSTPSTESWAPRVGPTTPPASLSSARRGGARSVLAPGGRRVGLAVVVMGLLLSMMGLVWLGWPPLWLARSPAAGGVLVTRSWAASAEVERTHAALCAALGGDRVQPTDAVVELPVHCATLSRWHADRERIEGVGGAAAAKAVIHVDEGMLRLHVLEQGRRLPLLTELPVLEIPTQPAAVPAMAAVLRGLLGPEASSEVALPVLDPTSDGFHWTVLAEWLRHYHGQRDPAARERLERLSRCALVGEAGVEGVYCDLARLLHALELPCMQAVDPLRALLYDVQASGRPDEVVALELARCLARSDSDAAIAEAEALIGEVVAARPHEPCTRASSMSTVARLVARGGDRSGVLQRASTLTPAELRACSSRTMVIRELLERAYVEATQVPTRWCDAARDAAAAHGLRPRSVAAATSWAEAHVQCPTVAVEERSAVLEALELARFDRGPARVSVAFVRWVITQSTVDALALVRSHDDVSLGAIPMLEGTASSLRDALCERPCAYELLVRPKQAGDREQLLRRLGLDGSSSGP